MNLVSPITKACDDLRQANQDGYLVNQSMLAFIFCKALMNNLHGSHVVYDGRKDHDSETRPNLYIWQEGTTPVIHFIGNLRYEPHDDVDDRDQIKSLENHAALPAIPLLDHDLISHEYSETQMETSPCPELGLFIVGEGEIRFQYWSVHREYHSE
jgi:hypothetical protein